MKRVRVPVRTIPSFAIVQALREKVKRELPPNVRKCLGHSEPTVRENARRTLSQCFAAAMRMRGWLAEEGYAK